MPTSLSNFRVVGLHGRKTVDIQVQDNRLILVGENGTGKSTLANLIYYLLTRQWDRVREQKFVRIEAELNGRTLSVTPEQLEQHLDRSELRHFHHFPRSVTVRLKRIIDRTPSSQLASVLSNPESVRLFSRELGVSAAMALDILRSFVHEQREPTDVQKMTDEIASIVTEQFLYLPTYRRIEHDLQSIFRGGEVDIEELRKSLLGGGSEAFIELVHFGMEDVEQKIQLTMGNLKENLRAGLDKLTGSYLRDVIEGVYKNVSFEDLRGIDLAVLDSILARIPDETLPPNDKLYLREKVSRFALASYEESDNVVAHFLLKLLDLYREQQRVEMDVRKLVDVCNVYLAGKELVYDDAKYEIRVQMTTGGFQKEGTPGGEILKLRMLSSGEKQIISLFSHIYLSPESHFFLIIDEPELSLSVTWQRRFLPDILKTGKCSGLIAVTHSPFIWQNELETYVRSVPELTVSDNGVR